ncbi:MAG: efflux RND transporter periplasmic adaptor subunit [Pseudomonadales bacterium]|nr:efflux RND transporter periplasmic adaptor subunit [Pseudomonadales bacterium]
MFHDIIKARRLVHEGWRPLYPRLFVTFLVLAFLVGCSENSSHALEADATDVIPATTDSDGIAVRVARVSDEAAVELLRFAGVTRPRQRANLSFQVGGTIETRFAEIGQQVEKGSVVARLYNPQLGPAADAAKARLAQLQNDAEQIDRDLHRLQQIQDEGLLAIQEVEQQRTLLRSTQAAIENARAIVAQNEQLQRESELRAPFAGRIEQILLEPGEFAQPGQPAMRMSAEGGLEIEVRVPPHLLFDLALGDSVPVEHALTGKAYEGRITEIGEGSSGNSALYPLVIGLQGTELRSGEALEVGISFVRESELNIPLNAIMRSAEGLTVFRINEQADGLHVERLPVSVRRITGDQVLLAPGSLVEGDRVVYAGLTRLADGDKVQVLSGQVIGGDRP